MMDSKYGILYTEDDVKSIVEWALEEDIVDQDSLIKYLEKYNGKFPKDEPLFLLRGQDKIAASAIDEYVWCADNDKEVSDDHAQGAKTAYDQFINWQEDNLDKVKVPD